MQPPGANSSLAAASCAQGRNKAEGYERRGKIGKGAFGDVFLAYSRRADQSGIPMVLKSIKLARQNEWQRAATHREIQLMAVLKHPFIVPFIDHWLDNTHTVNVVLGYCEQGDLSVVLQKRQGKLFDEPQLKTWLAQLLLALWYLEQQGVLHRDIKTSNIFLHADGHVQLGDFGLASVRDRNDDDSQHDQSLVGTPHFMSPELLSQKGYSHQTDVWSLGCVMYELSAQKPAFTAFNLTGLVDKIKRRGTAPLPAQYTADWSGVVRSMLRKDPEKRPTVIELMSMPCMQHTMAEACHLAKSLMSGVQLPPITFDVRHSIELTPADGTEIDVSMSVESDKMRTPITSSFACRLHNGLQDAAVSASVEMTDQVSTEQTNGADQAFFTPDQHCSNLADVVKPMSQPPNTGTTAPANANKPANAKVAVPSKASQPVTPRVSATKPVVDKGLPNKKRAVAGAGKTAIGVQQPRTYGSNHTGSEDRASGGSEAHTVARKAYKPAPNTASLRPTATKNHRYGSAKREQVATRQSIESKAATRGLTVDVPGANGSKLAPPQTVVSPVHKVMSPTNRRPVSARDRGAAYAAAHASFANGLARRPKPATVHESTAQKSQHQPSKAAADAVNYPHEQLGQHDQEKTSVEPQTARPALQKQLSGKSSGTRRLAAPPAVTDSVQQPPTKRRWTADGIPTQATSAGSNPTRGSTVPDRADVSRPRSSPCSTQLADSQLPDLTCITKAVITKTRRMSDNGVNSPPWRPAGSPGKAILPKDGANAVDADITARQGSAEEMTDGTPRSRPLTSQSGIPASKAEPNPLLKRSAPGQENRAPVNSVGVADGSGKSASVKQTTTRLRQLRHAISNPAGTRRDALIANLQAAASRLPCPQSPAVIGAPPVIGAVISEPGTSNWMQQGSSLPTRGNGMTSIPSGPSSGPDCIPQRPVTSPGNVTPITMPGQFTTPSSPVCHNNSGGQLLFQQNSYRSVGNNEHITGLSTSDLSDPQLGLSGGQLNDDASFERLTPISAVRGSEYASSDIGSERPSGIKYNGLRSTASGLSDRDADVAASAGDGLRFMYANAIYSSARCTVETDKSDEPLPQLEEANGLSMLELQQALESEVGTPAENEVRMSHESDISLHHVLTSGKSAFAFGSPTPVPPSNLGRVNETSDPPAQQAGQAIQPLGNESSSTSFDAPASYKTCTSNGGSTFGDALIASDTEHASHTIHSELMPELKPIQNPSSTDGVPNSQQLLTPRLCMGSRSGPAISSVKQPANIRGSKPVGQSAIPATSITAPKVPSNGYSNTAGNGSFVPGKAVPNTVRTTLTRRSSARQANNNNNKLQKDTDKAAEIERLQEILRHAHALFSGGQVSELGALLAQEVEHTV